MLNLFVGVDKLCYIVIGLKCFVCIIIVYIKVII